jgi:copper transporter 1
MYNGFGSSINGVCMRLFFNSWILDTRAKYVLAVIGVLLLGIAMEALVEAQTLVYHYLLRMYAMTKVVDVSDDSLKKELLDHTSEIMMDRQLPSWCLAIVTLIYICTMVAAYFLMLVAMTYEIGLFMAAIIGLGLGYFFFKNVDRDVVTENPDPCCST